MWRCPYTERPSAPIPIETNPPEHPASQPGTFKQSDLTNAAVRRRENNVET